jgi:hypothetical protein
MIISDFRGNWLREDRTFLVGVNEVSWHMYRETAWRIESKDSLDNICGRKRGKIERPVAVTNDNVLHHW